MGDERLLGVRRAEPPVIVSKAARTYDTEEEILRCVVGNAIEVLWDDSHFTETSRPCHGPALWGIAADDRRAPCKVD
jgi:hypothetical protein